MKTLRTFTIVIIAGSLAFSGCDKKPGGGDTSGARVSEADTIANFKKSVEAVVKWEQDSKKDVKQNDMTAGVAMMNEMIGKFQGISTDGLPADLKQSWVDFTGVLGELGTVLKGMPKIAPDKPEEGMKAMMELMPKMMALQTKVDPIVKKLSEVGKKYGIDDLEKVGPDKGGNDAPPPAAPVPEPAKP